ncbi:MAG: hypothetical protein ACKVI4_14815 [Actinomycetales bacterium]|tara:strand:- start:1005 stop:2159 length:1155 start_codon:yes stop_codon:yes gene_type:complete
MSFFNDGVEERIEAQQHERSLYRYFHGLVVGASNRRSGLTVAIEQGVSLDPADDIGQVPQYLWEAAAEAPETAWFSKELDRLVPLLEGEIDIDPATEMLTRYPVVPVKGRLPLGRCETQPLPDWCLALQEGYARDRVIAYARVKQAMLDVANFTSSPEVQERLFAQFKKNKGELRAVELALRGTTRSRNDSAAATNANKRAVWSAQADTVPDAHRQQPTFIGRAQVNGKTSREIDAEADDPAFKKEATHVIGSMTGKRQAARDALIGTELMVSLVFPDGMHAEMHAVGAGSAGVPIDDADDPAGFRMPAMVTLHNATGAIESICREVGMECQRNVFVTSDAAELLAKLHALIVTARKTEGKGGATLPRAEQRDYLLLEHKLGLA